MNPSSRLRGLLLAAALVLTSSCGDAGAPVTSPAPPRALPPASLLGTSLPTGLLKCTPLPYDSVTQAVGPAGGVIAIGAHSLTIPPGALDSTVTITAVAPADTVNRVAFRPEGLVFQQTASLTMSYANCDLLGLTLPKQIAYTTDLLQILEYLISVDNPTTQTVTGQLHHFSDYAIAW